MTQINKNIEGYEMVANVTKAFGGEYTPQTHLFIVKRNSNCGWGSEGLDAIVAVCENTNENYERFRKMCPFNDKEYDLEFGTIFHELNGTDYIEFHWS
jgi:hypothetical protein